MGSDTQHSPVGSFVSTAARNRFEAAYRQAMEFWPKPHQERDVATDFGSTRTYVYGSGSGLPLVLLAGQGGTPAVWSSNVAALAADRTVYAPERPGEPGHSTHTAPVRSVTDLTTWLEQLLTALELPKVHLAGASQGAWSAVHQALRAPNRLASLALADPAGTFAPLRPRFLLGGMAAELSRSERVYRNFFHRLVGDTGASPEVARAQTELALSMMLGYRSRSLVPRKVPDDALRSVHLPVLALFGGNSLAAKPQRAAARARLLPDVQLEVIPGAGHTLPVEVLNSHIPAFLREVESRAEHAG